MAHMQVDILTSQAVLETVRHNTVLQLLVVVSSSWLLWRLWKFSLLPLLYPGRPKELPYCIPFIGHGFDFFRNADAVLAKSRYFGTKEPFSLVIFGNVLYIITDPEDTNDVYKSDHTLSFQVFTKDLFRSNGFSESGLRVTYADQPKNKPGFPNPRGVSFGSFFQQMCMTQLYSGKNLQHLEQNFCSWFGHNLTVSAMHRSTAQLSSIEPNGCMEMLLGQWCDLSVTTAGEFAYFGAVLGQINSNMADDFLAFDRLGWQVLYSYPAFLSHELRNARSKALLSFKSYLKVPQDQRTAGGAVWLVKAMEDEARAIGLSDDDLAVMIFNIYWVISTNTRKVAFWLLTYVLHTPSLLSGIRNEIAPAFDQSELTRPSHLWENCPQLDTIWHEALRLCSNAASARFVERDTVVGGKLLQQGNRVMIPYRLLHFDAVIYGEAPQSFRPERFSGKNLAQLTRTNPAWRPFGGGKTLCTGRHAAKHATLIFVATLLRRFNVELVEGSSVPQPDLSKPVLGISSVRDGGDFRVRISPIRS